jgi:hypothetical protein
MRSPENPRLWLRAWDLQEQIRLFGVETPKAEPKYSIQQQIGSTLTIDHTRGQIVLYYWDWYVPDNPPDIFVNVDLYATKTVTISQFPNVIRPTIFPRGVAKFTPSAVEVKATVPESGQPVAGEVINFSSRVSDIGVSGLCELLLEVTHDQSSLRFAAQRLVACHNIGASSSCIWEEP